MDKVTKKEAEKFLQKANQEYAVLKKNPKAWKLEIEELEEWDVALEDGLERYKS